VPAADGQALVDSLDRITPAAVEGRAEERRRDQVAAATAAMHHAASGPGLARRHGRCGRDDVREGVQTG